MNAKDQEALAAVKQTIKEDAQCREDINRAIERHDRAYVRLIVEKLKLPVVLANVAYEWLKERL